MLNSLLGNARLGRLAEIERFDPAKAYPLAEFMSDVKRAIWNSPQATAASAVVKAHWADIADRVAGILDPAR